MAGYTYDDFYRAANDSGMLGQFSEYDLRTAQAHPEFGLSMLSLKKDYANAGTDEQRALLHAAGEELRKSYGGYSGGEDGSRYYAIPKTAGSVVTSAYDSRIDDTLNRLGSYGSFQYDRENDYQRALGDVMNREAFSWDKDTDPSWQAYKKQYTREGKRATEDTLGSYAAMTGGMPSSAAVTAATQAGDYYASQMSDKIPELYQQAYSRYLQDYQDKLKAYDAISQDRQRALNEYNNGYNMLRGYLGDLQGQSSTVYSRAMQEAEQAEAARQYADRMAQQDLENRMQAAQLGYNVGDYSALEALGITPNRDNVYADALAAAGRVTPVGSGSGGSGNGARTGGVVPDTEPKTTYSPAVQDFLEAMKKGLPVPSDVIAQLLAENYTMEDIEQAYPDYKYGVTFGASEDIYDDVQNLTLPANRIGEQPKTLPNPAGTAADIKNYNTARLLLNKMGVDNNTLHGLLDEKTYNSLSKNDPRIEGTANYQDYLNSYIEYVLANGPMRF